MPYQFGVCWITRKNGIKYKFVSSYHQASNDQVESAVKSNWEGCQVEHWKQSFHGSNSPTGQHLIPQLELHQQNCWWKGCYRQIWTGWAHLPLPLYSSAKIIRNSIMTELLRYGCFTKARRFLLRTLTIALDGWLGMFWRVLMPYLSW